MGYQTEVLIAELGEAQAVANSDSPSGEWDGFSFTGFDHVQLCTLLSLLSTGRWDTDFDRCLDSIEVVQSTSDDWPVVSVVKSEQVAKLATVASLDDVQFESLAASWAATEEFDGWTDSDVRELLRELTDLADRAALQNKCLMIWQAP